MSNNRRINAAVKRLADAEQAVIDAISHISGAGLSDQVLICDDVLGRIRRLAEMLHEAREAEEGS